VANHKIALVTQDGRHPHDAEQDEDVETTAITAMRLSEDGVLVLTLTGGQNLILPVARIDDLEQAAAFFTGEEALQHLINPRKENQP